MNIFNQNIVDQLVIFHCELSTSSRTTKHPEIRRDYFTVVKIHTDHNIPFYQWCKKIEPFVKLIRLIKSCYQKETPL